MRSSFFVVRSDIPSFVARVEEGEKMAVGESAAERQLEREVVRVSRSEERVEGATGGDAVTAILGFARYRGGRSAALRRVAQSTP